MIKSKEISDTSSCLNRAVDHEMLFVLLGRDAAAPVAIRAWIEERIRLGKNNRDDEQIVEAEKAAAFIVSTSREGVVMNRTEHLLSILAEECAEVAQRASKAMRFGLTEVEPGQLDDNASRMMHEFLDLCAVVQMMIDEKLVPEASREVRHIAIEHKQKKIEKFLAYSKEQGTLT